MRRPVGGISALAERTVEGSWRLLEGEDMATTDRIKVHEYGQTYIARWRGKTASCTAGALNAAWAVATEVLGRAPVEISGGPRGHGRYVFHAR